ncbi:MAG TPA: ABC transporter substrate-binding protein, partial [Polyangia bacterium]
MTKIVWALLATTLLTAEALAAPAPSLKGVCPDKIVIQTDWFATPERAAAYQLVGAGAVIDKKKGTYSGPLGSTGVNVEVRLGGPFIGFQPIPALMYQNPEILLGYVATDDAVQAAAKFPTKAVVAPLDINPQVLIWDPASFTVQGWPDIAKTKAKI